MWSQDSTDLCWHGIQDSVHVADLTVELVQVLSYSKYSSVRVLHNTQNSSSRHRTQSEQISHHVYQELSHSIQEKTSELMLIWCLLLWCLYFFLLRWYCGLKVPIRVWVWIEDACIHNVRNGQNTRISMRRAKKDLAKLAPRQQKIPRTPTMKRGTKRNSKNSGDSAYTDNEERDQEKIEKLWPTMCASGCRRIYWQFQCRLGGVRTLKSIKALLLHCLVLFPWMWR